MSAVQACEPDCPPHAVSDPGEPLALRDGSKVLVRQLQPSDAALVTDVFAQLSDRSRRLRFLTGKKRLSAGDLRALTDLDSHDRAALGALNLADGRAVGIARYGRDTDKPDRAEVAVTVVDNWQRRGLGRALLTRLAAHARNEGVRRFTAMMSADNVAMLTLLRSLNAELSMVDREYGTVRYELALDRRFCDLCGRRMAWAPDGAELLDRRPKQVCTACIRTYVPKIQANLADPWWL